MTFVRWVAGVLLWITFTGAVDFLFHHNEELVNACFREKLGAKLPPAPELIELAKITSMEKDEIAGGLGAFSAWEAAQTDPEWTHVKIPGALTDRDMYEIEALSSCVSNHVPELVEDNREFYQLCQEGSTACKERAGKDKYQGGQKVVYMNGFWQHIMPVLSARLERVVVRALENVRWGPLGEGLGLNIHPDTKLSIRCVEHLHYGSGGYLGMHEDSDSVWTVVVMLSGMEEYVGGESLLYEPISKAAVEPSDPLPLATVELERGDMIVFHAERPHAVADIKGGNRRVLVLEYWDYPESGAYDLRPDPIHV